MDKKSTETAEDNSRSDSPPNNKIDNRKALVVESKPKTKYRIDSTHLGVSDVFVKHFDEIVSENRVEVNSERIDSNMDTDTSVTMASTSECPTSPRKVKEPDLLGTGRNDNSEVRTSPQTGKKSKLELYSGREVAKILGVDEKSIRKWRNEELFGCCVLPEYLRDHNGVYFYDKEFIDQLATVFRKDWRTAWTGRSDVQNNVPNNVQNNVPNNVPDNVSNNVPDNVSGLNVNHDTGIKAAEIEIKRGDPSLLESAGILQRAAKSGYICLVCGNGSGENGTGTQNFVTNKGYTVQKCFKCGKSFNNLELIARAYNLHIDDGGKDYYEAVKFGSQLFGIELDVSINYHDIKRPLPKMEFEPPKIYSPAEIVGDTTKKIVDASCLGLSNKPNAIFNFQPLRHKGFEWLFAGAVPIKQVMSEHGEHLWRCLADSEEYDLKKDAVYNVRTLYARYFKMPAGGDVPEEFALYKKICSELKISFKTKAQEKAEYDAKVAELVHADIEAAVANIDNSPVEVRRGLPVDILKELRFGWLEQWIHPAVRVKGDKAYSTRRFLATTPNHYEAMTPKADRKKTDSAYWKMHTAPREPFFLDVIPFGDVNLVFEGAVDAASAYYALDRKIPCYATGGTSQFQVFVNSLNKICSGKKPRFVILYDSDEAGRKVAPEFQKLMRQNGYTCAIRFLADDVSKIDANDILLRDGKDALANKIKACLADIDSDLSATVEEAPANKVDEIAVGTRDIIPNCPVNLRIPARFYFSKYDISREVVNGNNSYYATITNTPMVITRIFSDERDENGVAEIAIYDRAKNRWHFHRLLKELLASNAGVLKLTDFGALFSQIDARYVSKYLMNLIGANMDIIPRCKNYKMQGWTDSRCTEYIFPVCNDKSYIIGNGSFDYQSAYTPKGDKAAWTQMFSKVIRQSYVARLVCGLTLAAPLIRVCKIRNLQLHLCGPSGSGKTALAKFAMSIAGNPEFLMSSFNGSLKSIEDRALIFNDSPHTLNELQTQQRIFRDEAVDSLIYSFEDGTTRSKLDKNSNQREIFKFRGCRISTGEQSLTKDNSGSGAKARVIELPESNIFPTDDYAVELHNFCDGGNFGHYWQQWIRHIADVNATDKEYFHSEFVNTKDYVRNLIPTAHPSHGITIAVAYFALSEFTNKVLGDAALQQYILSIFAKDVVTCFKFLPTKTATENAERARNVLAEFVYTHSGQFDIECVGDDGNIYHQLPRAGINLVGYQFVDGSVGFAPYELRRILENEYKFPSANAILTAFADKDWIVVGNDAKHKFQKRKVCGEDNRMKWIILFCSNILT